MENAGIARIPHLRMQNTESVAHSGTAPPLMATYRRRLHSLLTPAEHRLFARLDTPQKVQDFLDRLPVSNADRERIAQGNAERLFGV